MRRNPKWRPYFLKKADAGAVHARTAAAGLAGLVAVAAGAERFAPAEAILIGLLAGAVQPFACRWLAVRLLKEDYAAANLLAALGVCGFLGALGVTLLGSPGAFFPPESGLLIPQAGGALAVLAFGLAAGIVSAGLWKTLGLLKWAKSTYV